MPLHKVVHWGGEQLDKDLELSNVFGGYCRYCRVLTEGCASLNPIGPVVTEMQAWGGE